METALGIQAAPLKLEEEPVYEPDVDDEVDCGDVCPAWTPPLCDFRVGSTLYKWFKFVYEGGCDLVLVHCGDDGEDPVRWLEWEELADVMDSEFSWNSENRSHITWALEHGLSPGQPFLARIDKPTYSKSGGWDGPVEYDVNYSWQLVRKLPKSERGALLAWERVIKASHEYPIAVERHRQKLHLMRLDAVRQWKVESHVRGEYGTVLSLNLTSCLKTERYGETLASGSSGDYRDRYSDQRKGEESSYALSFQRLIEDFLKKYPDRDVSPLLALANKTYVSFSQLDRLLLMQHDAG